MRLTLNIEKSVIEKSKQYAKNTDRSLSEIIQTYLETILNETTHNELSSKLKNILGSVNLPNDFDENEVIRSVLEKKHLRGEFF